MGWCRSTKGECGSKNHRGGLIHSFAGGRGVRPIKRSIRWPAVSNEKLVKATKEGNVFLRPVLSEPGAAKESRIFIESWWRGRERSNSQAGVEGAKKKFAGNPFELARFAGGRGGQGSRPAAQDRN